MDIMDAVIELKMSAKTFSMQSKKAEKEKKKSMKKAKAVLFTIQPIYTFRLLKRATRKEQDSTLVWQLIKLKNQYKCLECHTEWTSCLLRSRQMQAMNK